MKTLKYIGILILTGLLAVGVPDPPKLNAQPGVSVSFQVFFNSLSPYGRWSNHAQYGSIWIPSVHRDFHPYYTDGRWVMTEFGNTWVSDYDWGWAPFHYGRWFYDDFLGWAWVPDYTWGPGWVNWRNGGGYYGWAPLMPGISVRIAINLPLRFWIFVPHRHFMNNGWARYRVPYGHMQRVYNQTTVINNYYTYNNYEYAYGPRSSDIERTTRKSVPVYAYNSRENNGRISESVSRVSNAQARRTVEAREQSLDRTAQHATERTARTASDANLRTSSPTRATTDGSRRTTPDANMRTSEPARARTNSSRTSEPAATTERSSRERVSTPDRRSSERYAPEMNPRTREATVPDRRSEMRERPTMPRENQGRTYREPVYRSRESEAPNRAPVYRAPAEQRAPQRAEPMQRSGARESYSPSRSQQRETVSPNRGVPAQRGATQGGRSGRGEMTQRGAR